MMWGVFAEMERDIISQRVKSGMENAKAKGKKIGRPKSVPDNIPDKFYKHLPSFNAGNLTITEFANLMKCSRTTIYKYIRLVDAYSHRTDNVENALDEADKKAEENTKRLTHEKVFSSIS